MSLKTFSVIFVVTCVFIIIAVYNNTVIEGHRGGGGKGGHGYGGHRGGHGYGGHRGGHGYGGHRGGYGYGGHKYYGGIGGNGGHGLRDYYGYGGYYDFDMLYFQPGLQNICYDIEGNLTHCPVFDLVRPSSFF